jgi:hypothetical protein
MEGLLIQMYIPGNINMSSIECFEMALKDSHIISIDDVDDESKMSKVDISLFATGLIKAMGEYEDGKYLFHRAYLNDRVEDIAKYLCVFSKRTYIGAGKIDFIYAQNENCILSYRESSSINNRTIKVYIAFRELFKKQIAFFAPTSGYIEYDNPFWGDSYDFLTPLLNNGYKKVKSGDFCEITNNMINKLYIGLPWLKNARVEDYIDIVNKYHDYFLKYSIEVRKAAEATDDINKFQYDLIKDIQEAIIDIRIAFEKKKSELKTKGIITTMGVLFTTMSFLIPDISSVVNPEWLVAILGGGSLYEFFNGANDRIEMINMCKNNTFFPIWEWHKVTNKK